MKKRMKLEIEVDVPPGAADMAQLTEHLRKEAILALFAEAGVENGEVHFAKIWTGLSV